MKEENLQIAVSKYIRLKYPQVIFTSESSGLKLTIGQAVKAKKMRSERGLPDMIILEPKGKYCGLCLELKREDTTVFLKDGSISKSKHIQEQAAVLRALNDKGYYATFAVGIDEAMRVVDRYMKQ